jgi:hypothetical protein
MCLTERAIMHCHALTIVMATAESCCRLCPPLQTQTALTCCLKALVFHTIMRIDAGANLSCSCRSAPGSEEAIPVGTTGVQDVHLARPCKAALRLRLRLRRRLDLSILSHRGCRRMLWCLASSHKHSCRWYLRFCLCSFVSWTKHA